MKTVTLIKQHTHAGTNYSADTVLENVSDKTAEWMLANKIAKATHKAQPSKTKLKTKE